MEADLLANENDIQSGVISQCYDYASYTTIFLKNDFDKTEIARHLTRLQELAKEISRVNKRDGHIAVIEAVIGIEPTIWRQIHSGPVSSQLKSYEEISYTTPDGKKYIFPKTGGDLFLYVKSPRMDLTFEVARKFVKALNEKHQNVLKLEQTIGWKYLDGRDLSGFMDGSRNAPSKRAIIDSAVINVDFDVDNADWIGGSFVFTSKFLHDLDKFDALNDETKSNLVGRDYTRINQGMFGSSNPHLKDAIAVWPNELSDHAKQYHLNRGYGLMYRQAMPFGTLSECGLFFIAFSGLLSEFDTALQRMVGAIDGLPDRIFTYSTPLTTNYYYCPSLKELNKLAATVNEANNNKDGTSASSTSVV
jgi:putative iron-dependent peroxidase